MISRENYKSVRIHIITFKENLQSVNKHFENMNEERSHKKDYNNKFTCSVCLNSNKSTKNTEDSRKHNKHPKRSELCFGKPKARINCEDILEINGKENKLIKTKTVAVQTQEDCNKSIKLLNEVLTVFQNKKQNTRQKSNTVILKDAGMSTEDVRHELKPRLQVSKVFQFSTDEAILDRNDKSTIITSHEDIIRSQYLKDFSKHKSSSIPQTKSEELRNSSKEKKSKNAIEEVNRIFGNVKRRVEISDSNRPLVRNGPRILPVVKRDKTDSLERILSPCNCQSGDLSSGDSFVRPKYCQHKENGDNSDQCVYMMCCLKNCHKLPTGVKYCQYCHGEHFHCNRNRADF